MLLAAAACTALAGAACAATTQPFLPAPPLPQSDQTQAAQPQATEPDGTLPASAQWVDQQITQYRHEIEARVARGDMSPDEAERLIGWRQWQLSQQAAGNAPQSTVIARQNDAARAAVAPYPGPYYGAYPAPYPYYRPYAPYYGYGPYYPGISVCAGGSGHHGSASVCF